MLCVTLTSAAALRVCHRSCRSASPPFCPWYERALANVVSASKASSHAPLRLVAPFVPLSNIWKSLRLLLSRLNEAIIELSKRLAASVP